MADARYAEAAAQEPADAQTRTGRAKAHRRLGKHCPLDTVTYSAPYDCLPRYMVALLR